MVPAIARLIVAFSAALFALLAQSNSIVRGADDDPEFDGVKVSKWVDTVQNDPSARKRALAVDALGKIWIEHKHKDALPNIGRALRLDTSASVRAQAAIVLAGMHISDLGYFSKDLIDSLKTEKESRVRKEIVAAMIKFPATCVKGVESLVVVLKDPEPGVRILAAEALALAGAELKGSAKSAAPDLVPLLKDENKSVRMAGVYALGRIEPEGGSTLAETMAAMLGTEKDADMKRALISSIGLLAESSPAVVKALSTTLFDEDDEVRRASTRVLGIFGTAASSAADDLYKVFTTEKLKDIRVDAVRAFGSALGPQGLRGRLKDLRPLLKSDAQPDFEVRLAIVDEIGSLGWEHVGAYLNSTDPNLKAEAEATIVAVRGRLADPQVKVREAATVALRKLEKKPDPKKDPDKKPE